MRNCIAYQPLPTNIYCCSYTLVVKVPLKYKSLDIYFRIIFKIKQLIKPKNLDERNSSEPYLSPDTYFSSAELTITSEFDLQQITDIKKDFESVYIAGELIEKLISSLSSLRELTIGSLVIGESDTNQSTKNLEPLLNIAQQIYSNNLIGSHHKIKPIPLGLERQCYRSSGELKNFRKPYNNSTSKRSIPFLIAWNDSTNSKRKRYRSDFMNSRNSLILNKRYSAKVVHKLMRNTMFIPSPAGKGLDCHRTWEALYLGCVPVILKNEFCGDKSWPILIVDDWDELIHQDKDQLSRIYAEYSITQDEAIEFGKRILKEIHQNK